MMSNRLIKTVTNLGEVPANDIGMTKLFFNIKLLTQASNSKNITKNYYTTTNLSKIERTALNKTEN